MNNCLTIESYLTKPDIFFNIYSVVIDSIYGTI